MFAQNGIEPKLGGELDKLEPEDFPKAAVRSLALLLAESYVMSPHSFGHAYFVRNSFRCYLSLRNLKVP